jgi:hypothetical protein
MRRDQLLSLIFESTVPADERVGRAVMLELGFELGIELGNDPLGKHVTKFDAPLVE